MPAMEPTCKELLVDLIEQIHELANGLDAPHNSITSIENDIRELDRVATEMMEEFMPGGGLNEEDMNSNNTKCPKCGGKMPCDCVLNEWEEPLDI